MTASGTAALLVFMGAGMGALLRWTFGLWWNPPAPGWPWGTLAANLVGGLAAGMLLALLTDPSPLGWSPETTRAWRWFAVTGFLGGLTTFSTFSAEVVQRLDQGQWAQGALWALMHLAGSLALTALGLMLARLLWPPGP